MSVRVYKYGLLPPTVNAQLVREQMSKAHKYRNRLVEIERKRRDEQRAFLSSHGEIPQLEANVKAAQAALDQFLVIVRANKADKRTRVVTEEQRVRLKQLRADARNAKVPLAEARRALHEDGSIVAARDALEEKYNDLRKAARADCGVYWGTYLLIEDEDMAARKMPLYEDGVLPNNPRFVSWNGDGRVGVQIQKGLKVGLISTSTHVRIDDGVPPKGADPNSKKSLKRHYAVLSLRIGSDGNAPVWAQWPLIIHRSRSLPEDGVIKRVIVNVRRVGRFEEWSVDFTVDSPSAKPVPASVQAGTKVAIDIGWRQLDGKVRVAAWRSSHGESGTLLLDESILSGMKKADDLQAIRKKNFNIAIAELRASLPSLVLPDWFPTNLGQWESMERLYRLAVEWKSKRFDGDTDAWSALERWRYQDHHLRDYELPHRNTMIRFRRETYRIFASQMAKKFDVLVLEKFDLRAVAKRPKVDEQAGDNVSARSTRHRVATSDLRICLKNAFGAARVVECPAEYTTKRCAVCGSIEAWDQAADLEHTCSSCGVRWDQDDNATKNLLSLSESMSPPKPVEAKESRWAKARRMSTDKKTRKKIARSQASTGS